MPREKYYIKVEVLSCIEEQRAIAQAAAHLADAVDMAKFDQDTMDVKSLFVHKDDDGPIAVSFTMDVTILHVYDLQDFEAELNETTRVLYYSHNPQQ